MTGWRCRNYEQTLLALPGKARDGGDCEQTRLAPPGNCGQACLALLERAGDGGNCEQTSRPCLEGLEVEWHVARDSVQLPACCCLQGWAGGFKGNKDF